MANKIQIVFIGNLGHSLQYSKKVEQLKVNISTPTNTDSHPNIIFDQYVNSTQWQ